MRFLIKENVYSTFSDIPEIHAKLIAITTIIRKKF